MFHRNISRRVAGMAGAACMVAASCFLLSLEPVQAQSLDDFGDCAALGPLGVCAGVSGNGATASATSGTHGISAEAGQNYPYAPAGSPPPPIGNSLGGTNSQGNFDGVSFSGR